MTSPTDDGAERPTLQDEFSTSTGRLSFEDAPPLSPVRELPPIVGRELIALPLIVVLSDLTVYRGRGPAGFGLLFLVAPLLLWLGTVTRRFHPGGWVLLPLLLLTSVRLVWCGSSLAVLAGFVLLCGFTMSLSGLQPYVLQAVVFAAHLIPAGHRGLHHYSKSLARFSPHFLRANWFAVILPLVMLLIFGMIFVMANPDLVKSFHSGLTWIVEGLERWLDQFHPAEILFCIGVGWIALGALRPDVKQVTTSDMAQHVIAEPVKSPLYDAFRNTLVMLIGLFAIYLVFEFQTLWFRVFPKGFYYSGYAHEGAAWLTVALGLATITLSVVFRGQILGDPRLPKLRLLSWIWSVENLILALAVFNRLFIYVGFNGMTRMRVVGLLGVASVVGGLLLVLRKISRNHDFVWLIRRQLWTVSFAAYLYAVLPVDAFVNEYNVRRILSGDPAPSVQISVHPTTSEGLLRLEPLLQCKDDLIREGIRAMLCEKLINAETQADKRRQLGWTAYQLADDLLLKQLRAASPQWEKYGGKYRDEVARREALDAFHRYAYQWF
jgi:Domain of unknown function (DUF4173)